MATTVQPQPTKKSSGKKTGRRAQQKAAVYKFEEELNALCAIVEEPAADDSKAYALVVSRTSWVVNEPDAIVKLKNSGKGLFSSVYPMIDNTKREVKYVLLNGKSSPQALTYGDNPGYGPNAVLQRNVNSMEPGSDVHIFVQSLTGLNTNFTNLQLWAEDLVKRLGMNVKLYFWSAQPSPYRFPEGLKLCSFLTPIVGGVFGYGMFVDVGDLIADQTLNEQIHALRRAFGRIDVYKASKQRRPGAQSYRNTIPKDQNLQLTTMSVFCQRFA